MQIADPGLSSVITDDHPTGALGFRYLLHGTPSTPENYMMQIAENLGHFKMVTHRHNFDQFRYVISGKMNLGRGRVLREGQLCYFPEGTSYGPQDDAPGPVALVIQFGGASGYGYMSPEQYRAGRARLKNVGRFEGPVFIRDGADGKPVRKLSINAIWEEAMGERMMIPAPRYHDVVIMDPRAYRWMPLDEQRGVSRKLLGTFTERGTSAAVIRIDRGSHFQIAGSDAIRLFFLLSGEVEVGGLGVALHGAMDLQRGEATTIDAREDAQMLMFTLPMLPASSVDPQQRSEEPLPDESVADVA